MIVILEAARTKDKATTGELSRYAIQARQIRGRVRETGYSALRDVTSDGHEGVAFLDGQLRTYYLKQVAQTVAIEMDGIVRVENRIEVVADRRDPAGSNDLKPARFVEPEATSALTTTGREGSMLILSRKLNESIVIGENIRITVASLKGRTVRIGIQAPKDVAIYREELCTGRADVESPTERDISHQGQAS